MKLIIADDESLVRISLKSMIKDMEAAWSVAGEAANGEELLTLLAEHKPDAAIVDIRMPKLSGLDAIRLGKELSPLTRWIILSGYTDFSYAQQAVKLGASEYLVKPVNPAELERVLLSTHRDNKEYMALLNEQFENNVFGLCNHLTSLKQEQRGGALFRWRFAGLAFVLDTALPVGRTAELECALCERLRELRGSMLTYGVNVALTALPNSGLAAVVAWDPERGEETAQIAGEFLQGAAQAAIRHGDGKTVAVTLLATEECVGFEAMSKQLQQLQTWAGLRVVRSIGRTLTYGELKEQAGKPGMAELGQLLLELAENWKNGLILQYQQSVGAFEALLGRNKTLMNGSEGGHTLRFLTMVLGLDIPEEASASDVIALLRQHGERTMRDKYKKEAAPADLVEQAIRYIDKHYMNDIGISQIASELNVSATYLSTAFHKKTGVPYVKYVTRIRMYKAKELLLETNLQVKQIAEQIGYYSTRHFTKLFTEAFGSYPSDYRKMQQASYPTP